MTRREVILERDDVKDVYCVHNVYLFMLIYVNVCFVIIIY